MQSPKSTIPGHPNLADIPTGGSIPGHGFPLTRRSRANPGSEVAVCRAGVHRAGMSDPRLPAPSARVPVGALALAVLLLGCGSDGGTDPVTPPPDPPVATTVEVTPDTVRFTTLGDTVDLAARVIDQYGDPMPSGAVAWQGDDPRVALVRQTGPLSARVIGRGPGATRAVAMAGSLTAAVHVAVDCDPIVLDPGLRIGEPRRVDHADLACGASLEAPEAGAYYRLTLVGTAEGGASSTVELAVAASAAPEVGRRADVPRRVRVAPGTASPSTGAADPHPGRRERDRRLLSRLARPDGPRPLPDLRGRPRQSRTDPPARRTFTRGSAGTVEDNCTVAEHITGVRLAFNDHIAIYADSTLAPLLPADDAAVIADYYRDFGEPVIRQYFGGVGDVDGDGRILVLFHDFGSRVAAFVWMGELMSKDDCPASNQAELIRVTHHWMKSESVYELTGLVVHEAKHISSHHQLVRRAAARGAGHFDVRHPSWVEEGTAEIAREMAGRLGWESIGGPRPGATVRGPDLRRINGTRLDMFTPEANGVRAVLEAYGQVVAGQPNSVTEHDPYGAGWDIFRFLGDWYGGAGDSRLGDAGMFARLNDAEAPEGLDGIREVIGRSFPELMVDYAQAVSLAGTGSPEVAGVPRFTSYDMTGMDKTPFSFLLSRGPFPYPVTLRDRQLWLPLGEPVTIAGEMGPNGFRVHDFRADRAGEQAVIWISAPAHVVLVVTRIPDQSAGTTE